MPRACTVCEHPKVNEINQQLAIEANSNRKIAEQYGLKEGAVRRHRLNHLPKEVIKARQVQEGLNADAIWKQLQQINMATLHILKTARDENDHDLALKAIARAEKQAELIMKLLGELDESPQINVNVALVNTPQWVSIRTLLLQVLTPYPDARIAVAQALQQVKG
jgi:hypothetical protein